MRNRTAGCALAIVLAGTAAVAQRGGGGMGGRINVLAQFDKDGDGHLNTEERRAAREYLASTPRRGRGFGGEQGSGQPGPKVSPAQVHSYKNEPFYDMPVLRTL